MNQYEIDYKQGYDNANDEWLDRMEKIRAEIEAMFPPVGNWMYEEGHEVEHIACEVLSDVLQIIDKYKEESEEA